MFSNDEFSSFIAHYSENNVWPEYQRIFRVFWNNVIMNNEVLEIHDSDVDPIIRMLDQNGKGNTKGSIVVAKAFIRMGMWYRAFRSLKDNQELRNKFNQILNSENDDELIVLLNEFYELNSNERNGLCGKSAVIINAILCLNKPFYFISAASLEHRNRILKYLYGTHNAYSSFGENIVITNREIINFFRQKGIDENTRKITLFLYSIKGQWLEPGEEANEPTDNSDNEEPQTEQQVQDQVFVIEKYLEDFLIGNWETTDLGKKYDLLFENDELVSQQYKTEIGTIDLLVKEKTTGAFVVIELKRNQTSDITVGQIMRYMGWVKAKLSPDKGVKGLIIGYENDLKLKYAISCVANIEVLLYRIKFELIKPDMNMT